MKAAYLIFFYVLLSYSLHGQEANADQFIRDMRLLAERFSEPASRGAAYQSSAGWYLSGRALNPWDFWVSVHANALVIPSAAKTFTISNAEFDLLEIEGKQQAQFPSAFGAQTSDYFTGEVTFLNPVTGRMETRSVRFKGFDGIDRNFVPHSFIQISMGLPKHTELTVRFLPEVRFEDIIASTYGIGVKHSLSQYFALFDPEGFNLAVALAYSKFDIGYEFAPIEVENLVLLNQILVDADLWMLELLGSRKWQVFEIFAAAGVVNSGFDYAMHGGGPALVTVNQELQKLGATALRFKGDLGVSAYLGSSRISLTGTLGSFLNVNLGVYLHL